MTDTLPTVLVAVSGRSLRSHPSLIAHRLAAVPAGVRLPVLGVVGEWIHTRYNKHDGWMRTRSVWGRRYLT